MKCLKWSENEFHKFIIAQASNFEGMKSNLSDMKINNRVLQEQLTKAIAVIKARRVEFRKEVEGIIYINNGF